MQVTLGQDSTAAVARTPMPRSVVKRQAPTHTHHACMMQTTSNSVPTTTWCHAACTHWHVPPTNHPSNTLDRTVSLNCHPCYANCRAGSRHFTQKKLPDTPWHSPPSIQSSPLQSNSPSRLTPLHCIQLWYPCPPCGCGSSFPSLSFFCPPKHPLQPIAPAPALPALQGAATFRDKCRLIHPVKPRRGLGGFSWGSALPAACAAVRMSSGVRCS